MTRKRKSIDAGSASKPARSRDVVSFSEKLKILDMIEIEKKYFVIARLYGKVEYADRELLKNKEKIHADSSSSLQTAKCTAIARD